MCHNTCVSPCSLSFRYVSFRSFRFVRARLDPCAAADPAVVLVVERVEEGLREVEDGRVEEREHPDREPQLRWTIFPSSFFQYNMTFCQEIALPEIKARPVAPAGVKELNFSPPHPPQPAPVVADEVLDGPEALL